MLHLPDLVPEWLSQGFNPTGRPLILAVSGGADSLALLRFFASSVAPSYGCRLHVAHIHHGLRKTAEADAVFVAELCAALHLPFRLFRLDPKQRAKRESLEAWARRERYAALLNWADEVTTAHRSLPAWVLTAHHREDWVETVALRLLRGEDWRAFLGMPFSREGRIFRPFLHLMRQDLTDYLAQIGQTWCHDESNDDVRLTRNFLRKQGLPALEKRFGNSDWKASLWHIGQTLRSLQPWLETLQSEPVQWDSQGRPFLSGSALENAVDDATWTLRMLRALVCAAGGPPAIPRKTFMRGFQLRFQLPMADEAQGGVGAPKWTLSRKWQLIGEKIGSAESRFRVQERIPEVARKIAQGVQPNQAGARELEKAGNSVEMPGNRACNDAAIEIILNTLPGEWTVTLAGLQYRLRITPLTRMPAAGFPAAQEGRVVCDAQRFSSTLVLRTRQAGDRFSPLGTRSRTRKLKSFLNERRVPASQRNTLPLVFSGDELVWVPGYGLSEWFKVTSRSENLYEMVLECLTMTKT